MNRTLRFAVCLFLLFSLTACGEREATPGDNEISVCYAVSDSEGSRDVVRYLTGTVPEGENPVDAAFALLKKPPVGTGVYSPLPSGLTVRSWVLKDGSITVDLSAEYGELTGVNLALADSCIVLTLTKLDGIDSVCLTIQGGPVPQRELQVFTVEDLLLQPDFDGND